MTTFEIAMLIRRTGGDRHQLFELGDTITPDQVRQCYASGLITGPMMDTSLQCIDTQYAW